MIKTEDKYISLKLTAEKIRKRVIEIIYRAKSGHTGGSLSIIDILTVLYFNILRIDPKYPEMPDRDRFILSKGHSVESLFCILAEAGFLSNDVLMTYGTYKSKLAGHPTVNVPGIEICSGALGHGLSVGAGMALSARMDKRDWWVFVLMGDGEQNEGSVYEAAMAARHYQLDNLIAIIDRNNLQISGNTENIMTLEPIDKRWEAMGWEVLKTNGHDIGAILYAFSLLKIKAGKPHLLIADTIKGKGISFMENDPKWHHGVPNENQYHLAIKEIDDRIVHLTALLEQENE